MKLNLTISILVIVSDFGLKARLNSARRQRPGFYDTAE